MRGIQNLRKEKGFEVDYTIGTMIELPRAALRAGEIARDAAFFSFGTNDLTQTAYGLSRDDSGSFLQTYQQKGVLKDDPFVTLDVDGVGELVKMSFTIPSVSFPLRWSFLSTIETLSPGLMSARLVPSISSSPSGFPSNTIIIPS